MTHIRIETKINQADNVNMEVFCRWTRATSVLLQIAARRDLAARCNATIDDDSARMNGAANG